MTIHDHYGLGCAYGTIALHRERKTHQWILNVQFETAQVSFAHDAHLNEMLIGSRTFRRPLLFCILPMARILRRSM